MYAIRRDFLGALVSLAFATGLLGSAHGGSTPFTFSGSAPGSQFGRSVALLGDANADGFQDWIVGAPLEDSPSLNNSGSATVFSGKDGSILHKVFGQSSAEEFGAAVSGAGDWNGDGYGDFLVGAPKADQTMPPILNCGAISVFSGADGSKLFSFHGSAAGDLLGTCVASVEDLTGDGKREILLGAPQGNLGAGYALVLRGGSGSQLYQFAGVSVGSNFAKALDGAGDLNADGKEDLLIGASLEGGLSGRVQVYSGANGALLYSWDGVGNDRYLGGSVSGLGDVNADGFDDVIAGAHGTIVGTSGNSGRVKVFSGADGAILWSVDGLTGLNHQLGWAVSEVGDVDLDGHADFAASSVSGAITNSVKIFSGKNLAILFQHLEPPETSYGYSLSAAGDIDANGYPELLVGSSSYDLPASNLGAAFVYSICDGRIESFGAGCSAGTGSAIDLAVSGLAEGGKTIEVSIAHAAPNQSGLLFLGLAPSQIPMGYGCNLLVAPLLPFTVSIASNGVGSLSFSAPLPVVQSAWSLSLQAFVSHPAATGGFTNSNAVKLVVPY